MRRRLAARLALSIIGRTRLGKVAVEGEDVLASLSSSVEVLARINSVSAATDFGVTRSNVGGDSGGVLNFGVADMVDYDYER